MAGTQYWGTGKLGSHQSVAYTGTAGVTGTKLSGGIYKARIACTSAAYIRFGDSSVSATTSDVYIPADSIEYFTVAPGQYVSAIQVAAGGTLHVTEVS